MACHWRRLPPPYRPRRLSLSLRCRRLRRERRCPAPSHRGNARRCNRPLEANPLATPCNGGTQESANLRRRKGAPRPLSRIPRAHPSSKTRAWLNLGVIGMVRRDGFGPDILGLPRPLAGSEQRGKNPRLRGGRLGGTTRPRSQYSANGADEISAATESKQRDRTRKGGDSTEATQIPPPTPRTPKAARQNCRDSASCKVWLKMEGSSGPEKAGSWQDKWPTPRNPAAGQDSCFKATPTNA